LDKNNEPIGPNIGHLFFQCPRWMSLLTSSNFDDKKFQHFIQNHDDGTWLIDLHTEFKNYNGEIELFLDWLLPYIENKNIPLDGINTNLKIKFMLMLLRGIAFLQSVTRLNDILRNFIRRAGATG
jgi:hypothetical protein